MVWIDPMQDFQPLILHVAVPEGESAPRSFVFATHQGERRYRRSLNSDGEAEVS